MVDLNVDQKYSKLVAKIPKKIYKDKKYYSSELKLQLRIN